MNKVANFLTSFKAVVVGLLIFVAYRYFEVQSLFYRYLPLPESLRLIASILVAFVVIFSLLLFSAHLDRFKLSKSGTGDWIKRILFAFTLFVNFFFWSAWSDDGADTGTQTALVVGFKMTIVLFFALFDYAYNHLFISLWNERFQAANIKQSVAELEATSRQLQQAISEGSARLSEILARDDPKVCPRCGNTFESPNHRNGHLRTCKQNLITNHPLI
ncbi:MAG: hypothetical protein RIB86_07385 [Imperialibacter sp.]